MSYSIAELAPLLGRSRSHISATLRAHPEIKVDRTSSPYLINIEEVPKLRAIFAEEERKRGAAWGGKEPSPIRTAIPVLRELFLEADRQGLGRNVLALRAKQSPTNISNYRHGKASPTLATFEELADAVGLELTLKRKEAAE